VWGKDQIKSVDGARPGIGSTLEERFPASASTDPQKQTVTLHFR
jgi:hypothetical protein